MMEQSMKRQLTSDEIQDVFDKLQAYLSDAKKKWDDQQSEKKKSWFKLSQKYLINITKFLVDSLDELINFVENLIPEGKDKKAAVLAVIAKLFDYIAVQTFPLWLKPFSNTIKAIVVYIICSQVIDFIVAKYNAGYWNMEVIKDGKALQKQK